MVGPWYGGTVYTGESDLSNPKLKGKVKNGLVYPTLMWDGSPWWNLEVWMRVIANICPCNNLCWSLLHLFQWFLTKTFCCLHFLGWCVVSSMDGCLQLFLQPALTTINRATLHSIFKHVLYAGWCQIQGLGHIWPLNGLYLLWTVLLIHVFCFLFCCQWRCFGLVDNWGFPSYLFGCCCTCVTDSWVQVFITSCWFTLASNQVLACDDVLLLTGCQLSDISNC